MWHLIWISLPKKENQTVLQPDTVSWETEGETKVIT